MIEALLTWAFGAPETSRPQIVCAAHKERVMCPAPYTCWDRHACIDVEGRKLLALRAELTERALMWEMT